jgi:hypothetical protein
MPSTSQVSQLQVLMAQYASLLQAQIADSQMRAQDLQTQMQRLIQQQAIVPIPSFHLQLMALQQKTTAEQDKLQQLFLQYSQALTSSQTMSAPMSSPAHGPALMSATIAPAMRTGQLSGAETLKAMEFKEVPLLLTSAMTTSAIPTMTPNPKSAVKSKRDRTPAPVSPAHGPPGPKDVPKTPITPSPAHGALNHAALMLSPVLGTSSPIVDVDSQSAKMGNMQVKLKRPKEASAHIGTDIPTCEDDVGTTPAHDNIDIAAGEALFPAFNPTDMSFLDLNFAQDDLIPYTEELQNIIQEKEPLTDKRGSRPSSQTLEKIDSELADLDRHLAQLSKTTGIPVASIMRRWNTTKSRGGGLWNIYQRYFNSNKDIELARLGLDKSTEATSKTRADAYIAFRNEYPTFWPEILEVWAQYTEVETPTTTLQQCSLRFGQTWRTITNIVCLVHLLAMYFSLLRWNRLIWHTAAMDSPCPS